MTDISREAVSEHVRLFRKFRFDIQADTLNALRADLDAAEARLAEAVAEINRKADFIDDLLNKMAQMEQDFSEALNAPNRHAYKVGVAFGKAAANSAGKD